jgi:Rad3-related DNA helicase
MARAIVLVGIPFPNISDPKLQAKRTYLDNYVKNSKDRKASQYTGSKWYQAKATRSVNQAIGRVIRHMHDYGAIFLIDRRYKWPANFDKLSDWVKPGIKQLEDFYNIADDLDTFYQEASEHVSSMR